MVDRLSAALVMAVLLASTPAVRAQERVPDDAAQEVQALLLEGHDRLRSANATRGQAKALADAEAEAKLEEAKALYEKACDSYAKALAELPRVQEATAAAKLEVRRIVHYNVACARAGQGRNAEALDAFAKALEAGYDDFARIETDPDLDPLRKEARFEQLLERIRAKLAKEAGQAGKKVLSKEPLFVYDLEAKTLDGEAISLTKLRGKVVVVDYWGTWCPPCRQEIPHFVKLQEEFGDKLVIVGMTWERGNTGEKVVAKLRRFAEKLKINYPLVLISKPPLDKVPEFKGFPTTLFLDKQGRVRAKEVGYCDFGTLHEILHALDDEVLQAPPPKKPPERVGPF